MKLFDQTFRGLLVTVLLLALSCAGGGGGDPIAGIGQGPGDQEPIPETPTTNLPNAIQSLSCLDRGNESEVEINWEDNSNDEESYLLQRETQFGEMWINPAEYHIASNQENYLDSPGVGTYRYRIAARNSAGQSAWSGWALVSVTDGWTRFTASVDTRIIYVSSSLGNDANSGLSESSPKRTIPAGYALLRNGFPDWLLLQRGDVWTNERFSIWDKSGRSLQEPILVGAYGSSSARPRILTGNQTGIQTQYGPNENFALHDIAFVGFELEAHTYDGSNGPAGIHFLMPTTNLLLEDLKISGFSTNLILTGPGNAAGSGMNNLRVRRCVIVDAYCNAAHSQGLFASGLHEAVIEENVFDHNGWKEGVANATIFNHNLYITNGTTGVVLRRNIISNGSSHGIQLRSGGEIRENLMFRNALGLLFGGGDTVDVQGVNGSVIDNMILEGKDISPTLPRGFGIDLKNVASAMVRGNIIANKSSNTSAFAIGSYVSGGPVGIGVNNTAITENYILNWAGPFSLTTIGAPASYSGNTFSGNTIVDLRSSAALLSTPNLNASHIAFANNRFWSAENATSFSHGGSLLSLEGWRQRSADTGSTFSAMQIDSRLSLSQYALHSGIGSNAEDLIQACRNRSRFQWNAATDPRAALAYFRQYLPR